MSLALCWIDVDNNYFFWLLIGEYENGWISEMTVTIANKLWDSYPHKFEVWDALHILRFKIIVYTNLIWYVVEGIPPQDWNSCLKHLPSFP